ncbi:hypothetical protein [Natrinema sp. 74]|uniref:hypothetical protein n=1 Tax=Natrinema sp. 74 TaxID=3384159 RepID=UPI0038D42801
MGKEPWPDDIEETTLGHPEEDWDGLLGDRDPNVGKEPWPDELVSDGSDND